jgi:hypothetical protein
MMPMAIIDTAAHGPLLASVMVWNTGWSLMLGFAVSAVLQSIVSADALRAKLGSDGVRPTALATLAGAASSAAAFRSPACRPSSTRASSYCR